MSGDVKGDSKAPKNVKTTYRINTKDTCFSHIFSLQVPVGDGPPALMLQRLSPNFRQLLEA